MAVSLEKQGDFQVFYLYIDIFEEKFKELLLKFDLFIKIALQA